MSKMVVLPKITLYIGWLVCVLVIPVGHENEKGFAPVLLQVQAFCYMQICILYCSAGHHFGQKDPILMPEMDGCAAARAIRHCGKPEAKPPPTDNGGLVG